MNNVSKTLRIWAAISLVVAVFMFFKGYDKMTNYYMGTYSHADDKNAYVGGDAYNYIINGNYSTGFYVLSMGFFLSGVILLSSASIVDSIPQTIAVYQETTKKAPETDENISELLPEV
ncbi:MAG: hypothetical protein IKF39_07040 [Oscillospiraceae bacterium]|nr:hypothetical protein [Oscillospiraceae bacterium]